MNARSWKRRGIRGARAGFTLIELLAVLLIVSILAVVLVTQVGSAREAVEVRLTRVYLEQLAAALGEYESEFGDWPRSAFGEELGSAPNTVNLGAECLVVQLWSEGWEGGGLGEDRFVNADGDRTNRPLSELGSRELFEFSDDWGNPIAFFHRRDYGRVDLYQTWDPTTGERLESRVQALKNPTTGRWYAPHGFQLFSAGPDGLFGTEDDLTSRP